MAKMASIFEEEGISQQTEEYFDNIFYHFAIFINTFQMVVLQEIAFLVWLNIN